MFVMLADNSFEKDPKFPVEEIRAIREKYKQSGLYRNDDSDTPIWTVDWYEHSSGLYIASDSVHLIQRKYSPYYNRNAPASPQYDQKVLSFFANGKLLRGYSVNQIINRPEALQHSVSHFEWVDREEFNDAKLRYLLWTKEGNWFDFDVTTGQIVDRSQSQIVSVASNSKAIWIVPVGILLLCAGVWLFWRMQGERPKEIDAVRPE
ncbi:MAG TPA: hypothetical protein VGP68_13130 [Gemmataceae bacterium]|nr:hypothetical protein [Gemmataceae bacterium]